MKMVPKNRFRLVRCRPMGTDHIWTNWQRKDFLQICFSIILAPKVTAATADNVPIVWSDKPISHLNFFFMSLIVSKFDSFNVLHHHSYIVHSFIQRSKSRDRS